MSVRIEFSDNDLDNVLTALHRSANDCDEHAEEAETAAEHGEGGPGHLIGDYRPVARAFRESAKRYRGVAARIERQMDAVSENGEG